MLLFLLFMSFLSLAAAEHSPPFVSAVPKIASLQVLCARVISQQGLDSSQYSLPDTLRAVVLGDILENLEVLLQKNRLRTARDLDVHQDMDERDRLRWLDSHDIFLRMHHRWAMYDWHIIKNELNFLSPFMLRCAHVASLSWLRGEKYVVESGDACAIVYEDMSDTMRFNLLDFSFIHKTDVLTVARQQKLKNVTCKKTAKCIVL